MENKKTLVNTEFRIPTGLVTDHFLLRMLTIHDLVKDYDAVVSSTDHLKRTFSGISGSLWPDGLTLEQNLIDLGWHQREFTLRYSFAYTVMSSDEQYCLGCVYINPSRKIEYDAAISMWARESELSNNLDAKLYFSVKSWIHDVWPFSNPAYPGREITIEEWNNLADAT